MNKITVGPTNSTATVPLQCYLSPPFCKTHEMKKKLKKKEKKRKRQTQVSAESKRHLNIDFFVIYKSLGAFKG